jgi:hypothetical protein
VPTSRSTGTIGIIREKVFGLPVDRKVLFTNHKNVYKKKIEKRQRKLIIKLPFLRFFLKENEDILLVTTGYSPTGSIEKFLIGWFFVYLKRSLFVFTNRRIFHIPTTPSYKFRHSISEIIYSGCKSITLSGSTLAVEYHKFLKVEKFFGIDGREKKKLRTLLDRINAKLNRKEFILRNSLCPQCTAPLQEGKYTCKKCQLKFKTRFMASVYTLLLPGGGYLYIRQYFLGVVIAIIELVLLTYLGLALVDVLDGDGVGVFQLISFGFALIFTKCLALLHVKDFIKEFIPHKRVVLQ